MVKSTRQLSDDNGQTAVKTLRKKVSSGKVEGKKVSAKSTTPAKNSAAKKPVTKKAASGKGETGKAAVKTQRTAKKTVAKKTTAKKKSASKSEGAAGGIVTPQVTYAERHQMIAEVAYLIAESKNFLSDERENWFHAETAVDCLLARKSVTITD